MFPYPLLVLSIYVFATFFFNLFAVLLFMFYIGYSFLLLPPARTGVLKNFFHILPVNLVFYIHLFLCFFSLFQSHHIFFMIHLYRFFPEFISFLIPYSSLFFSILHS